VHSPKCGSGNRPIDKEGALALLEAMLADDAHMQEEAEAILAVPPSGLDASMPPGDIRAGETYAGHFPSGPGTGSIGPLQKTPVYAGHGFAAEVIVSGEEKNMPPENAGFVVLDVETRHSAQEVGGWHKCSRMGVSVAVLYDSRSDAFTSYTQEAIPELAAVLAGSPLVVGFNLLRFDYAVLEPHAPGFSFRALPTLDMLQKVHEQLSYRISLDNLAQATLGSAKSADGLQALQWWKEQKLAEIEEYCRKDVAITRDIYLYGREHGHLLFTNKAGQAVRVKADW